MERGEGQNNGKDEKISDFFFTDSKKGVLKRDRHVSEIRTKVGAVGTLQQVLHSPILPNCAHDRT